MYIVCVCVCCINTLVRFLDRKYPAMNFISGPLISLTNTIRTIPVQCIHKLGKRLFCNNFTINKILLQLIRTLTNPFTLVKLQPTIFPLSKHTI